MWIDYVNTAGLPILHIRVYHSDLSLRYLVCIIRYIREFGYEKKKKQGRVIHLDIQDIADNRAFAKIINSL